MEKMLYDVRKDAIEKLRIAGEEDSVLLMDAINSLKAFFDLTREAGLLSLYEAVKDVKSMYLKRLAVMIADGTDPEDVVEIGTNEYWMQNPQGIHAMVYYVYLRGMLYIQEGVCPHVMEMSFRTLVPEKWHSIYYERFGDRMDETLRYEKIKKNFFALHPLFEKMELLDKISALEAKVKIMDNTSVQKVIREMDNDILAKCLYGFGQEVRGKIIDNLSERLGYMAMEDAVFLVKTEVGEKDILDAVNEMNHFIDRLYYLERDGGECMQVSIYSREAVGKLLQSVFPEQVAVISFYDPPSDYSDPPVDYSAKTDRVFAIAIHDGDLSVLPEYHLTYDTYFPEADKLAEFIYEAKSAGLDIICQCEYGESRSAGCAAAILEHFFRNGISVFADYRYFPNQMIYHKVFDALEKAAEARG